ncbi:MAG: tetratricopeptide repeat protein [Lachnospiraceae bacterium]|nr:leucine-rich repeat domain-containing protein [uncultured Acetatifactor sp.]MCI8287293.1 tetratricopeptide repeat protein [Lachnospiraceae bacterium]
MKRKTIAVALAASIAVSAAGVGLAAYMLRGGPAQAIKLTDLSMGEKYLAELDYEKATATLENVITVEPNNTEAYLALAQAYQYMGDLDAAKETLESGYGNTGSELIERALTAWAEESEGVGGDSSQPEAAAAATVEIAGRIYAADVKELVLRNCGLQDADLQKLAEFTNLERLDISGNGITDISAVGSLITLKKFYAANNAISDVSALAQLPALEYVGLRNNQIENADGLFGISSLKYLHLSENQIVSVPQPGSGLQLLYLSGNQVDGAAVPVGEGLLYCDIR